MRYWKVRGPASSLVTMTEPKVELRSPDTEFNASFFKCTPSSKKDVYKKMGGRGGCEKEDRRREEGKEGEG